jgi:putative oxidoreductase
MSDPAAVDTALLGLRLVAGLGLAFHGYAKIARGGKLAGTGRWFDSIGMRPGALHARLAAFTEVGAGLLLAAGLLTPLAGAGFVGLMAVAFWTVHKGKGFLVTKDGWEYNLVLATIGVTLGALGPGRFSLDRVLGLDDDLAGWTGLAIALAGGLAGAALQLGLFFRPPPPKDA